MKSDASVSLSLDPTANQSKQQDICSHAKTGHWTEAEHQIYLNFLLQAKKAGDTQKKGQPLFKRMSSVIGTRSPSQCRSHHQKFNPFNPRLRRHHKRQQNTKPMVLLPKSKQIMRKYFKELKKDLEQESQNE